MSEVDTTGFVECSTCQAKPGMPTLCGSCVHNRQAIGQLEKMIVAHKEGRERENQIHYTILRRLRQSQSRERELLEEIREG